MRSILCVLFLLNILAVSAIGAEREFRGAWVATVYNLDWPSKPGLPAATQKAQLRSLLDRAAELKLNAILLQVRPASDALYASTKEPWSEFLSGKAGVSPGYDPLEFAIAEAHARGLELHAWVNPFRAAISANGDLPANHVAQEHPEWVRRFGKQLWIDPGEPMARAYVIGVITDIVRRYDVDGVHIDDYFYPYPLKAGDASFPDDATWQRFGAKTGLSRADWRRENINDFVRSMYRAVKAVRSKMRVGISRSASGDPACRRRQSRARCLRPTFRRRAQWVAEGWVDYLAPQHWNIRPRSRASRSCSIGGADRATEYLSGPGSQPNGSVRSGRRAK
jgi:uncharacterized lipoprotein YddW (UPF0748 family)